MVALYLLLLLLLIIFTIHAKTRPSPSPPLPPGPNPWAIIGNLLHLTKRPHVSLQSFSKRHGPLISFRLGTRLLVVASSPAAAAEVLKTHDRALSARFVQKLFTYSVPDLDRKSMVWASDCSDNWKKLRSIFKTQLMSAKAIESQATVREAKAGEMVKFVGNRVGGEVNVRAVVFTTVFDSLSNLAMSKDCIGFEETETANRMKALIFRAVELSAASNLADFFPVLEKLDPQGLGREFSQKVKLLCSVWKPYVTERREVHRRGKPADHTDDFLDVFLENGLDDDQIDWFCLELFTAGTDSTTATTEWAMAELIRNRGAMNKLRQELKTELPAGKPLKESDVYQLPYLNAVIRETLRLHPPAPLLIPHRSPEALQVMNYTIPEGTRVLVNSWAIGRDSSVWGDDASSFRPERFLDSVVDFRGQDFELLPFGSGRRMCPGMPLAARQIALLLANLVWNFDWCLPIGEEEVDMEETCGFAVQKERPLLLVPQWSWSEPEELGSDQRVVRESHLKKKVCQKQ